MAEDIKFACPSCLQHITCDGAYGGCTVDCPACGNNLIVPHLLATNPSHPAMTVLTSAPAPTRPEPRPMPSPEVWSAPEWAQQVKLARQTSAQTAPHWVLSVLGTLIVCFVLKVHHASTWLLISCIIAGTALSAVLMAKERKSAEAYSLLRGLGIVIAACVVIPAVVLGILFIGCLAVMH